MFNEKKTEDVKLGGMVLRQDELEIDISYKGEVFVLQYPNPFQKAQIESDIARRLNGLPRNSYPDDHLNMLEAVCYVDALVIREKSPDWFTSAHTCYDEELIAALFTGYLQFRDKFRLKIRGAGHEGVGKGS